MPTTSHRLAAVRAADLLVLHIDLYNLVPGGIGLRREDPAAPAHVVLRFPSQHLLEEAFVEKEQKDDGGAPLKALFDAAGGDTVALARAHGAAPSRVAFTVPDEFEELPASLEELLEFLTRCRLNVVATAEGPANEGGLFDWLKPWFSRIGSSGGIYSHGEGEKQPSLIEPGLDQTAIELPYRVILSPPSRAGFAHEAAPSTPTGLDRVELWHSRLGLKPGEEGKPKDRGQRTVRAVWVRSIGRKLTWNPSDATGFPEPPPKPPFLAPMVERNRHDLAHLTSNYWQKEVKTAPIEVERLALSALGGWLDANGEWTPPVGITLEEWENRATLGRDHFVKVVNRGYYCPLGHRCARIEISERKWQETVPGRPAALRKRSFLITRVPELRFDTGAVPKSERQMPLKRVRLRTMITPLIEPPENENLFLVRVEGAPFRFAVEGEDETHNVTQFTMPLVYAQLRADGTIDLEAARKLLTSADGPDLGGSPVTLVPESGETGATTFPVSSVFFDADPAPRMEAGFHPKLTNAEVALPAVEVATGKAGSHSFEYATPYVDHGFGPQNAGEVFAKLPKGLPLDLKGSADKAGGLLSPSIDIGGLSRTIGPLGAKDVDKDLGELAKGNFDPAKFFNLGAAKLLGVFSLDAVFKSAPGLSDLAERAPKLIAKEIPGVPKTIEWTFTPELKPAPDSGGAIFKPRQGTGKLELKARIDTAGTEPKTEIDCTLTAVDIFLPSEPDKCIVIPIETIRFHALVGSKLDVDVKIGKIGFAGPLEFVETLRELIPGDGFSDPPALEVTPQGVSSGFSLALPDVAIGMFALQHVSLGARFELPFVGTAPTFSFNFCTRNEPFLLTVSAFGGGGFFMVKADPNGMQRLEASFEFGASVSMNFGVASGGVHVMAGIYFAMDPKGALLTGYFRAGGNVSVLGIVSISIELYLGLTYDGFAKKAIGRASLTVEIELCLFSTSVSISCERKLAGSAGDPPLETLFAPYLDPDEPEDSESPPRMIDPWADYCAAYA